MLNMDKHKIIKSVKSVTIDTIGPNVNIMEIPFQCLELGEHDSLEKEILRKLAEKDGMSYENFLVPPTNECYECGKVLTQTTAKGTTVRCASLLGLQSGTKFTYRCRPCSILYKYDMYEKECKYYFYQQQRHFVRANDSMFIERKLLDEYVQLSLHSQVSFESFAVCYNTAFIDELDHCEKTFVASNADINDDDDNDVVLDEGAQKSLFIAENCNGFF